MKPFHTYNDKDHVTNVILWVHLLTSFDRVLCVPSFVPSHCPHFLPSIYLNNILME